MNLEQLNSKAVLLPIACVVGIAIGWFAHPQSVRVEEKVRTVEVEKQVVVEKEVVRVEVVHVKDTTVVERWHREKTEEKKPDGTVTIKEVEDRNIDSHTKERENSTTVQVVEVEKQVVVEKEKIVEKRIEPILPNWHLGVLAGVAPRFDSPLDTPVVIGIEAERRILGPIWLGAWGMGGSPVVGGFKVVNASVGIKVGLEF